MAMKAAQKDIFKLCRILNFKPTNQQAELFKLIQEVTFAPIEQRKKGIFCKSGQGPGKTAASTVGATFRTIQDVNEQTLVTAPTMRQVRDVWMTEMSRTVTRADPEFQRLMKVDSTKVTICGQKKWGIFTATSTRPENLQGYHSRGLTVLLDEASGILRPIWHTVKGTTTGAENLILAIGNPNDRDTEFFDAFTKDAGLYHTLTWNAEDSPNVSKKHIQDMEKEYGRESDVFRVRVLGEFPRQNPNSVIRYEDLLWCSDRVPFAEAYKHILEDESPKGTRQIGIDLARFGSDESVVVVRYNAAIIGIRHFAKEEPENVVQNAFEWQRSLGWRDSDTLYCCDAGGMGQGVMHTFYENHKNVFEFHAQGVPVDTRSFHDSITEAYFVLRRLTKRRILHLHNDPIAFSQLVSRQYRFTENKFRLESKDEYLKRIGEEEYTSPDRADAIAMAFYPFASGRVTT
jgi:hypothetical protein